MDEDFNMKSIIELRQERKDLVDGAEAMLATAEADDRELTDDEQVAFDAAMSKAEAIGTDIENREKLEQSRKKLEAVMPRKVQPEAVDRPVFGIDAAGKIVVPYRAGKLKSYENNRNGEIEAYRSGMWLMAALFNNIKAQNWCRENGIGFRAAQSEGVNTAGGYLVPTEMERAIIDLRESYGVFRQQCRVMPMGSDTITIPRRTSGLTGYFVGENTAPTESQKAWDQVQLVAKKYATLTRYSSELNEDAIISIADDLTNEIAYTFAVGEDGCGFNGDGTSTYGGMTGVVTKFNNDYSTLAGAVLAASGSDTMAEIVIADLTRTMATLPQYALMNAKWYVSKPFNDIVFNGIKAAGGGNTIMDLNGATGMNFLGYPIVISQSLPAGVSTDYSNSVMALFGDLRLAATMGDRRGISVAISTDRYFDTDQIGIKGTERFDINVHDIGDTSTAGPIVALIGN